MLFAHPLTTGRPFPSIDEAPTHVPQELRFPAEVPEVRIRKPGTSLVLSPIRPNWTSFFAMKVAVPDDFLADRGDSPPQEREPV